MSKSKYSIFHVQGGFGKHVASTAVAKCIKNNHPGRELIVAAVFPEIFQNLPYVDRVYQLGNTSYFYQSSNLLHFLMLAVEVDGVFLMHWSRAAAPEESNRLKS